MQAGGSSTCFNNFCTISFHHVWPGIFFWIDPNFHKERMNDTFSCAAGRRLVLLPATILCSLVMFHCCFTLEWYLTVSLFSAMNQKNIKPPTSSCRQIGRRKNEAHIYPPGSIMLPRNIIPVWNNSFSISLTWHVKMTAIYKFVNNLEYPRICEWFSDSK